MNIRTMPLLGSLFVSGLLMLNACGSSSPSGTGGATGTLGGTSGSLAGATGTAGGHVGAAGGTSGAAGGTTGTAGGTSGSLGGSTGAAGGGTGTGSCTAPLPSCIQTLVTCGTVSGTCVQQMSGSAASGMYGFNICYSNGVKQIGVISVDPSTQMGSETVTVSKGGSLCYTEVVTSTGTNQDDNPVITIKNAAGTAVATVTATADGNGEVVTCAGQAAVVVPNDCMPDNMTTIADCTDGTCQ